MAILADDIFWGGACIFFLNYWLSLLYLFITWSTHVHDVSYSHKKNKIYVLRGKDCGWQKNIAPNLLGKKTQQHKFKLGLSFIPQNLFNFSKGIQTRRDQEGLNQKPHAFHMCTNLPLNTLSKCDEMVSLYWMLQSSHLFAFANNTIPLKILIPVSSLDLVSVQNFRDGLKLTFNSKIDFPETDSVTKIINDLLRQTHSEDLWP